ncbi:hypothetical protein KFK09_009232 [Dendrobium nobile]|uniref:Uncharacterized protein n=1 Tax=Dendrobium nobile TaxID=94219 RepID=A0A8T3BQE0_DENNO|nr:hypothetical protein KFK09_009232 [Dendrobium nobile]
MYSQIFLEAAYNKRSSLWGIGCSCGKRQYHSSSKGQILLATFAKRCSQICGTLLGVSAIQRVRAEHRIVYATTSTGNNLGRSQSRFCAGIAAHSERKRLDYGGR